MINLTVLIFLYQNSDSNPSFHNLQAPNKKGERRVRSVGTGLDRVVLSVAMGSIKASQSTTHLTIPLNNNAMIIQEE